MDFSRQHISSFLHIYLFCVFQLLLIPLNAIADENDPFADEVVSYSPGQEACCDHVDSTKALGPSDGGNVSLGWGGYIVLKFDLKGLNLTGDNKPDLFVVEDAIPENTNIQTSWNNQDWDNHGNTSDSVGAIDLDSSYLNTITQLFVKLTDANQKLTGTPFGGADIAAVAVNLPPSPPAKKACNSGTVRGNPCDAATGNKWEREVDFQADNIGLSWVRYYNSNNLEHIGLGAGWKTVFHHRLELKDSKINIRRGHGHGETWDNNSGQLNGDPDSKYTLTQQQDGFLLGRKNGVIETYDAKGVLQSIQKPSGQITLLQYDTQDRLSTVTGPYGHKLTIGYDRYSRILQVELPDGEIISYQYNGMFRLGSVTYPDDTTRIYHYDNGDTTRFLLTGITDENGSRYSTFAYDENGKAISTEHATTENGSPQEKFTFSYDSDTQTTITDASGNVEIMTFENQLGQKLLTSLVNLGDGSSITQQFDDRNNLISRSDNAGAVTNYQYNQSNQLIHISEAAGTVIEKNVTYEYLSPSSSKVTKKIEPSVYTGSVAETITDYDAQQNPISITETGFAPDGSAISKTTYYGYNSNGQVVNINGPRTDVDDIITFTYHNCSAGHECGQLASSTNALGHTTTYDYYDAAGRLLQNTTPNGQITEYSYTARGLLESITQTPGGRTTTFTHDYAGNLTSVTQADGSSINYEYDAANRLIGYSDMFGNQVAYTLDNAGNRIKEEVFDTNAVLTRTHSKVYNALSRVRQIIGAADQTNSFEYDPSGNLTAEIDPKQQQTNHQFDALGRLKQTTDPANGTTHYIYDALDNLISVTDPKGVITSYSYDTLGNLISQTSQDSGTKTFTYDEAGNRLTMTDARGITTSYSYDALNRPVQISYSDASQGITYSYDQGENAIGRLTGFQDSSGATNYSYDQHGNIIQKQSGILTTSYSYDLLDRLIEVSYPSGLKAQYHRNSAGQIEEITAVNQETTHTIATNINYAPFGTAIGWESGNGKITSINLDLDYRIERLQVSQVLDSDYDYDQNGNITSLLDLIDSANSKSLDYDSLDRLVSATGNHGPLIYTYDPVGNRTEGTEDTNTTNYNYANNSNRLLEIITDSTTTLEYDSNGNLINDGNRSYQYNAANRLTGVDQGTTSSYLYNAIGQRVYKKQGAAPENSAQAAEYYEAVENYKNSSLQHQSIAADKMSQAVVLLEDYNIQGLRDLAQEKQDLAQTVQGEIDGHMTELDQQVADADAKAAEVEQKEQEITGLSNQLASLNNQIPPPTTGWIPIGVGDITTFVQGPVVQIPATLAQQINDTTQSLNLAKEQKAQLLSEYDVIGYGIIDKIVQIETKQAEVAALQVEADALTQKADNNEPNAEAKLAEAAQLQSEAEAHEIQAQADYEQFLVYSELLNNLELHQYFAFDEAGKLLGSYDITGSPQFELIYFENRPIAQINAGLIYTIHTDHLNTPRAMTDSSGTVVWSWHGKPFGDSAPNEDPDGDNTNITLNLRFPGQYYDQETGLHYNYFRYYDPSAGRYITSDPIGLEGGLNTYAYVGGNPLSYIDPEGLSSFLGFRFPIPTRLLLPKPKPRPKLPAPPGNRPYPGNDPANPPGPGWSWRGKPGSKPGDKNGNWHNGNTKESLRPDLNHPKPVGRHWDYRDHNGRWWRIFPDGSMQPKLPGVPPVTPNGSSNGSNDDCTDFPDWNSPDPTPDWLWNEFFLQNPDYII